MRYAEAHDTAATVRRQMKRVAQFLLIPFWLLGWVVALIVVLVLAIWYASKRGYLDTRSAWTQRAHRPEVL